MPRQPNKWSPNSVYQIRSLGGKRTVSRRLAQMGILPGVEMTVVRAAPLGGPVVLATEGGQTLALRANELLSLECELVAFPLLSLGADVNGVYRVRQLLGGAAYQGKMEARGISVGTRLRILSDRPPRLELLPAGLVVDLGRGEAERLLVEPAETASHA